VARQTQSHKWGCHGHGECHADRHLLRPLLRRIRCNTALDERHSHRRGMLSAALAHSARFARTADRSSENADPVEVSLASGFTWRERGPSAKAVSCVPDERLRGATQPQLARPSAQICVAWGECCDTLANSFTDLLEVCVCAAKATRGVQLGKTKYFPSARAYRALNICQADAFVAMVLFATETQI